MLVTSTYFGEYVKCILLADRVNLQARRPLRIMHRVLCSGKENHDSRELTAGWLVGHTFLPVKAAYRRPSSAFQTLQVFSVIAQVALKGQMEKQLIQSTRLFSVFFP